MFSYNTDTKNLSEAISLKLTRNQIYPKYANYQKFLCSEDVFDILL